MTDINAFIDDKVKNNDVFLFMKGSPDFPQCGFSGQVVQILNYLGVEYGSANVLESAELRDGQLRRVRHQRGALHLQRLELFREDAQEAAPHVDRHRRWRRDAEDVLAARRSHGLRVSPDGKETQAAEVAVRFSALHPSVFA